MERLLWSPLGQKCPKRLRLLARKSTHEHMGRIVPLRDYLTMQPGRQVHSQQWDLVASILTRQQRANNRNRLAASPTTPAGTPISRGGFRCLLIQLAVDAPRCDLALSAARSVIRRCPALR
jgi:hypothetical protein